MEKYNAVANFNRIRAGLSGSGNCFKNGIKSTPFTFKQGYSDMAREAVAMQKDGPAIPIKDSTGKR